MKLNELINLFDNRHPCGSASLRALSARNDSPIVAYGTPTGVLSPLFAGHLDWQPYQVPPPTRKIEML